MNSKQLYAWCYARFNKNSYYHRARNNSSLNSLFRIRDPASHNCAINNRLIRRIVHKSVSIGSDYAVGSGPWTCVEVDRGGQRTQHRQGHSACCYGNNNGLYSAILQNMSNLFLPRYFLTPDCVAFPQRPPQALAILFCCVLFSDKWFLLFFESRSPICDAACLSSFFCLGHHSVTSFAHLSLLLLIRWIDRVHFSFLMRLLQNICPWNTLAYTF